MDVSDKRGSELLNEVASLTGLPDELVQNELQELLSAAGQNAHDVTLDQLRQAMLLYLESLANLAEQDDALTDADSPILPSV